MHPLLPHYDELLLQIFYQLSSSFLQESKLLLIIAHSNPFSNRPHAFNQPDGSFFGTRERNKRKEKEKREHSNKL